MATERQLLERARDLRRNPTEWEVRLWRQLSNSQLAAFKFRRQHAITPYICDFFCPSKGLVVELDGDTHDTLVDERRDSFLAARGFATLRFANGDVRENIEGVTSAILCALQRRPDRWRGTPHPNPSPEGEGLVS